MLYAQLAVNYSELFWAALGSYVVPVPWLYVVRLFSRGHACDHISLFNGLLPKHSSFFFLSQIAISVPL